MDGILLPMHVTLILAVVCSKYSIDHIFIWYIIDLGMHFLKRSTSFPNRLFALLSIDDYSSTINSLPQRGILFQKSFRKQTGLAVYQSLSRVVRCFYWSVSNHFYSGWALQDKTDHYLGYFVDCASGKL